MGNENVEAAKEQLGDSENSDGSGGFVPEGDEETASGSTDTGPEGITDRLFRTDRGIDLENTEDFWDPDGKGAENRFAAACKQAFGVDEWPPIVHMTIAGAEGLYLFIITLFAFDSGGDDA